MFASRSVSSLGVRPVAVGLRRLTLKPNLARFKLKELPPGNIVGTVNDAYVPPAPNHYEGGHHWTYERIVSSALVPLAAVPFVLGVHYPMVDATFCITLMIHCHAGFKACIIDYIPERVYGVWHKAATRLLTLGSWVGLYGIYLLETEANGLFDLCSRIFSA